MTFYGDNADIGSTGFTNRAQSAQVVGTWRLCTGGGYRNRCQVVSGNVRDLTAFGLSGQVGSAQRVAGGASADARAPGYDTQRYAAAPEYAAPPERQVYAAPQAPAPARPSYAPPAGPAYAAPRPDPYGPAPRDPAYGSPYGAPRPPTAAITPRRARAMTAASRASTRPRRR